MTISISRKQVTDLARNIDIPGKSYNQKLDIVAASFGFPNQATMMAVLNRESATAPDNDLLSGTIADWMTGDEAPIKAPVKAPAAFVVRRDGPCSLDVHVGGHQDDYTAAGGSSIRIERRGDLTRFMLYDACCEMPRIFEIHDFGPMREAPSNWKSMQRNYTEVTIMADGKVADKTRTENIFGKSFGALPHLKDECPDDNIISLARPRSRMGHQVFTSVSQGGVSEIMERMEGYPGSMAINATAYPMDSQDAFEVRCESGKSEEIDALPWMDMDSAPRDGTPFYAHNRSWDGRILQIRAVRFDAPDDRFPIGNDGRTWSIAPERWLPLDHPKANGLLALVRIDPKPEMPTS